MLDFIERLKSKPEHIRQRIAVGTAVGVTGVVTVVWAVGLILSGNLAFTTLITGTTTGTLAQSGSYNNGFNSAPAQPAQPKTNFDQLLGAVGVSTAPAPAPTLQAVDVAPTTTAPASQPTVIPF